MNSVLGKFMTVMIALFLVSYAGYQTFRYFYTGYKTENAYRFEVARSYNTHGILLRDETVLEQQTNGVVRYALEEGHKFIPDPPIAAVYSSQEAAEAAEKREALEREAQVLRSVRDSTNPNELAQLSLLNNDISVTLRQLTAATTAFSTARKKERCSSRIRQVPIPTSSRARWLLLPTTAS